jgi:hypothetical protein
MYSSLSFIGVFFSFFLNKQPDALIIQIYSVIKLYMFRESFLFQADSGWYALPSWLCLEAVIKNLHEINSAECTVENT